ncbi:MAG: beta-Ala-His dipeptidase [Candidatus Thorarchaeota archaeon]
MVWEIFEKLMTSTPRCSKHESRVRSQIVEWVKRQASRKHLDVKIYQDETGNLLIRVPPTPGMESCRTLILQAHLDMVCETNRPGGFDFEKSPIPVTLSSDGEWVTANGTTLGADNGIGVALALALIADDSENIARGPLEILLTVDEETGLTGAFGVDPKALNMTGLIMINLDTETFGSITIGSAGGGDIRLTRASGTENVGKPLEFIRLRVAGLQGGHSGVDIHEPRANAIKIVARLLSSVRLAENLYLCCWNGGTKHNAIPRESEAVFAVSPDSVADVLDILTRERKAILDYYRNSEQGALVLEPGMEITWEKTRARSCYSIDESSKIVNTLNALPHGYRNFSPDVPGLVETSCNVATINTEKDRMTVLISVRSSIDSELEAFRRSISDIGRLGGWQVSLGNAYPGWKPQPNSPFLQFVKEHYERLTGGQVKIEAVHAGLECGIIGSHIQGIQMVSIGPTVRGAHTPDERLRISDVGAMYSLLKDILRDLIHFTG